MNKEKNFLLKIKQLYNVVFKKFENITVDNKMRILRVLYILLASLLLYWVISIEPWEILDEPCFQSEKLLFIEIIFMSVTCVLFLLPFRQGLILSGFFLFVSYLVTNIVLEQLILYVLKLLSMNEVHSFFVYSFSTVIIFIIFGEFFLLKVGRDKKKSLKILNCQI